MSQPDQHIEKFWNRNPVGSNFIAYFPGKEFYETYDRFRYATEGHILEELDRLDLKGKRVLEIGLGQGADSMQLINRGAQFNGIDLTDESVRRVIERFTLLNKPYQSVQRANARQIPFPDNHFDVVYSHGVIHHSPDIEGIVDEIHRVLKPGGKAVIMLYHKSSFNYYVSIAFIRRVGLLLLILFPSLAQWISRATGESVDRIQKHLTNFRNLGWSYFRMKEFIHRSTDGPENMHSSVWTKRSAGQLFSRFRNRRYAVHFLNQRHLLGFQHVLPLFVLQWLSRRVGWHLWVFSEK